MKLLQMDALVLFVSFFGGCFHHHDIFSAVHLPVSKITKNYQEDILPLCSFLYWDELLY